MDEQNKNGVDDMLDPFAMSGETGSGANPYEAGGAGNPYEAGGAENPYGMSGTQNPYGTGETQNPYGMSGTQNPYGTGETQNSYGMSGTQNPYGMSGAQNPYGTGENQNPYGMSGAQNPYGTGENQNPYGMSGAQNPYGTNGNPNPYGTYGAGQNPYAMGGAAGVVPPAPPKPPRKKMSKKAKILLFGGIGLVALGVAAYFLCVYVFFPAKKVVKAALEESFTPTSITKSSLVMKELGLDTILDNLSSEGGEIILNANLTGDLMAGETAGGTLDIAMDKSAKQLSGSLKVNLKGQELEGELFSDADQTYVTLKDVLKGYYSIANKNIISNLKNSPLLAGQNTSALDMIPDISLDLFGGDSGMMSSFTSDDNKFWKDSSVSRDGSEKLAIGSESVSAKKYKVTVPKEVLQEMVEKAIDSALDTLSKTPAGSSYAGSITQTIAQAKSLLKNIFSEDFVYYIYLVDDKIVSIKANGKLNIVMYSLDYNLDFTNCYSDTQSAILLNASIQMGSQSVLELKGSSYTKPSSEGFDTEAVVTLSAGGKEAASLTYSQKYTREDQRLNGTLKISSSRLTYGDQTFEFGGKFEVVEKDKQIRFVMDEKDFAGTKVSGDITIKTKSAGIELKTRDTSKPVVNILTSSESEIKDLVDEASEKLAILKDLF